MLILATSKIQSNYQTTIPKEIRKNYDIDKDTVVEWAINDNGNPEINFRKKKEALKIWLVRLKLKKKLMQ